MRKEPRERNSHKKYALNRIDFDFLKGFLHLYIKEVLTFWSDQKEHKQMCLTAYKQWCLYLFTVDFLFFPMDILYLYINIISTLCILYFSFQFFPQKQPCHSN